MCQYALSESDLFVKPTVCVDLSLSNFPPCQYVLCTSIGKYSSYEALHKYLLKPPVVPALQMKDDNFYDVDMHKGWSETTKEVYLLFGDRTLTPPCVLTLIFVEFHAAPRQF